MLKFETEKAVEKYAYNKYRIRQLKRTISTKNLSNDEKKMAQHQMKTLRKKNLELLYDEN